MFEGENFCGFRGSPFNREYFPMNYSLVDKQYKSISSEGFPVNDDFPLKRESFPPRMFYLIRYMGKQLICLVN